MSDDNPYRAESVEGRHGIAVPFPPSTTKSNAVRHAALLIARLPLAGIILYALPESHLRWGNPYPGDGQQAMGFMIVFMAIGMVAAGVYYAMGCFLQFWLHNRPVILTVTLDLLLFSLFVSLLAYAGITAEYY